MPSSYHIIVAHDAPMVQSFLLRLIQICYPTAMITICTHGLEALWAFEQGGADLLLTDYHMPQMDGATLVRTLRARHVVIPIIGLSGDPMNGQELRQVGADAILCMPFLVPDFQRMVHVLLPPLATRVRGAPGME
jgi:CheY-like chemotaxis protein